ncbi:MAG: hypothetical protein GY801_13500 [bacterium]|nr:hypothetical protein [bacterium]
MGKDRKAKQQKKAKKSDKARTRKAQHKKQIMTQGGGVPHSLRGALHAPVYECWEPVELFGHTQGIGTVVITRKTEHHQILMGTFLVDVFCLGIKNALIKLLSEPEYNDFIQGVQMQEQLRQISPERARKLVEEAEAYALDLGFKAHRDYQKAKKIFGDIDPEACPDTFEFGRDGKPLYFAGPYDNRKMQERIMRTLTDKLGPDGFHFVLPPGGGAPPMGFLE